MPRRGTRTWVSVLTCAVAALCLVPPTLQGQETHKVRIETLGGELGGSFDGSWLEFGQPQRQETTSWREWLEFRLRGSVIHPDIVSFHVLARPLLMQGRYLPRVDSLGTGGEGDALSGSARMQLFGRSQVRGEVRGQRGTFFRRTRFGGFMEERLSEWSAGLVDRNPLLPMEVSYVDRSSDRDWSLDAAGRSLYTRERSKVLRYAAANRKTRLHFERLAFEQDPSDVSYVRRVGSADHTLRWGTGSVLNSRVRYVDRVRGLEFRTMAWSESATLHQSERVRSTLGGAWTRATSGNVVSGETRGQYALHFEHSPRTQVSFETELRSWSAGRVHQSVGEVGPVMSIQRSLPAGWTMATTLNASYERHGQTNDGAAFAFVFQEAHIAGPTGVFRLDRPFADAAGIVLISADGSSLYEEGLDYRVVITPPFVEIHVLPGGRIPEGEEVLVDYRYEAAPSVSADALTLGYVVSLKTRFLELFANRYKQNDLDDTPPAILPVLMNLDRSAVGARVSLNRGWLSASGSAERRRDRSDRFSSESWSMRASLTARLSTGLSVRSSADTRHSESVSVRYDQWRAEQSVELRPSPSVRLFASGSLWRWHSEVLSEDFVSAGCGVEWAPRARRVSLRYVWNERRAQWTLSEHRLAVFVSQEFGS